MSPIPALTDYYNRPTTRPRARPHISDTSNRNQYSETSNETIAQMQLGSRNANSRSEHGINNRILNTSLLHRVIDSNRHGQRGDI